MLIDLVHNIPGRIRFAIPALKGSAAQEQAFGAMPRPLPALPPHG